MSYIQVNVKFLVFICIIKLVPHRQDAAPYTMLLNRFLSIDPPDGVPLCSISSTNNYTDLALFCSWEGGYPPATLNWSPYVNVLYSPGIANITQIQLGPEIANNSVFTCYGSHVALNSSRTCSTRTCKYELTYTNLCDLVYYKHLADHKEFD